MTYIDDEKWLFAREKMSKEEVKRMYPTSGRTLHIPIPDFMKLPCETPEQLISTLKTMMRMHNVDVREDHDEFEITIDTPGNVVRVQSRWGLPF